MGKTPRKLVGGCQVRYAAPMATKYEQLADQLRAGIVSGEYPVGEAIPSENALVEIHGVSRPTVVKALGILKEEGLIESRQGSGTVVTGDGTLLEELIANIERVRSLAEAENEEGAAELVTVTENLIRGLPDDQRANVTKELERAKRAEPSTRTPAPSLETQSYKTTAGVPELVAMGSQRATEGMKLQLRIPDVARDVAKILLDARVHMTNSDGHPDLSARAQATKDAATDLFKGVNLPKGTSEEDAGAALLSFQRSVSYQMGKLIAAYVLGLDTNEDDAARFALAAQDKPDDVPLSQWVAGKYPELRRLGDVFEETQAPKELAPFAAEISKASKAADKMKRQAKKLETKSEREALKSELRALTDKYQAIILGL